MPFPDNIFDVVFSNSVVEHLPVVLRWPYAREIRRVSSRYFVQTPNRHFRAALLAPFAQYTPKFIQDSHTVHELQDLFPNADIVRERFLGATKRLIAIGTSN